MTNQSKWIISFSVAILFFTLLLIPYFIPAWRAEIISTYLATVFIAATTSVARNILFQS